jgi:hypothetical protein
MKIYGKCPVKNYSPQILDVRRELSDLRLRSSAVVQKVAEHVFALAQVGLSSLRKFPSREIGTHGLTEVSPALPELPSSLKCACSEEERDRLTKILDEVKAAGIWLTDPPARESIPSFIATRSGKH